MKEASSSPVADSNLVVTLTLGQLREIMRQEIQAAMHYSMTERESVKPYLSVEEAAALTPLAKSTIRLYIRKGMLKIQRVGRKIVIPRLELDRLIALGSKGMPIASCG
jgi:excisionase family DNA binding protein